ncbi:hypothetical protein E1295_39265 [Nonomuraea mesophila]|uniref:Uncharacterized protein n=1 Tax=Nonomuraea mesophila TaxID=2530382 RepID=A0A4R5EEI1_9ACTN|nr:hypothetical protein [Nonomuraea mesophila]TDE32642.1 hypothetical protein E1295_39265 [Nonomuraea mesophila]
MDGVPIPEQLRPWIGWVVGMDWPEGDEAALFRLADDLARAFHRINGGVRGDGSLAGGAAAGAERGDWDGAALRRFVERVGRETTSRPRGSPSSGRQDRAAGADPGSPSHGNHSRP